MADYSVEFVASAAKECRSLPVDLKHRVGLTVDSLSDSPFPMGVRKLHRQRRLHGVRAGQYRVVHEIDEQRKLVLVIKIRHRREAYR